MSQESAAGGAILSRCRRDGDLLFSPSDLTAYLACEHLTQLALAVARRETTRPERENPQAELIRRKADEHELAYLEALIAEGRNVVEIERGDGAAACTDRRKVSADSIGPRAQSSQPTPSPSKPCGSLPTVGS